MSVTVSTIHHFTIGCAPGDLPVLLKFYTDTLGLKEGYRPALRHPGHWLYADGEAIVHLNALLQATPSPDGGPLDHVALKARGLAATRESLRAANVAFSETPLKGTSLHQVFLQDPLGLRIELNFDLAAEG
ncbi:MAG TPA: VOC family protein [Burkholderiaceae bacterium]|nr:VOC family protein [Burkholderiaceae bacterium]